MALVDEIAVKIGADPTALKAALADSDASVRGFGQKAEASFGGLFDKMEHRLVSYRHLTTAVFTALGLNFEKLGESAASYLSGISEDAKKSYEKIAEQSDRLRELVIANNRAQLTDEQKLTLAIQDRATLTKQIAVTEAEIAAQKKVAADSEITFMKVLTNSGTENLQILAKRRQAETDLAALKEKLGGQQIALELNQKEVVALQGVEKKKILADSQTQLGISEEQRKAELSLMTTSARIAELKDEIAEKEQEIDTTQMSQENHSKAENQLAGMRKELIAAETEQKKAQNKLEEDYGRQLDKDLAILVAQFRAAKDKKDAREKEAAFDKMIAALGPEQLEAERVIAQTVFDEMTTRGATTEELKKQLAVLQAIIDQQKKVAAQVDGMIAQWESYHGMISGVADYASMSDDMLKGIVAKETNVLSNERVANMANPLYGQNIFGGSNAEPNSTATITDQLNLAGAQKELALRGQIQQYASFYGQSAAVQQFGDSAVSRAMAATATAAQNTLNAVTSVAQTLNRVFPSQATPVVTTH
jgi:ribosomal protein L14